MRKRRLPSCSGTSLDYLQKCCVILLAIGAIQKFPVVDGQFENFESSVGPCPSDNSLSGYTSIADINSDIDQELGRIESGGPPQDSYALTLCPGTFDTSTTPLLPRLSQASYSCAGAGNVNDACIFSGGGTNIRIEDPAIEGFNINAMNFLGITFTAFTEYSIELLGVAPTEAVFLNCLWQDFQATGIARISNDDNPPMDLEMNMCSIRSSTGETGDAILDTGFENNGGSMMLSSVLVEAVQVDNSMFRTQRNGATIVVDSTFQRNSMARLSQVERGMADFAANIISENTGLLRMFEVIGEGSTTFIQKTVIEGNIGAMAYQIFRITDGAEGKLLNSTIISNSPVEYGMYVLVETEGTTPFGLIEDTTFQQNTQEDWALVMSEGDGSFVDMSRNRFVENTGGIMNIGAFFGGDIRFVSTCFERNNHFLVALILENSEFEASGNYVEDEVSQICSGTDATQGPGRLSVEQPGSMCFQGGENCMVDCLPNANDSPVCLADTQLPSITPAPSGAEPSSPPTAGAPAFTSSPISSIPFPTSSPSNPVLPTTNPTPEQSIVDPSFPPTPLSSTLPGTNLPTKAPTTVSAPPIPMPGFQPVFSPTKQPSRPSRPTARPTTYPPPIYCKEKGQSSSYGYYGIGDCHDTNSGGNSQKYSTQDFHLSDPPNKESKSKVNASQKSEKESKRSKKEGKPKAPRPSSSNGGYNQQYPPRTPKYHGIGASQYYSSSNYEKSQFGIGYTHTQTRTIGATHQTLTDDAGGSPLDGASQKSGPSREEGTRATDTIGGQERFYGIGSKTEEKINVR